MQGTKVVSNRRPMTIYFKSWGSQVLIILRRNLWKYLKACFSACSDSGYVASGVNGVHAFFIYSGHQIGTKQTPHDHLFQKSGKPGLDNFGTKFVKIPKSVLFCLQWFRICCQWGKFCTFLLYICWAPNRRPMTMYFKSRGSRVMIILRWRRCLKISKSVLLLLQWFHVCSQWGKSFAFLHYICGALIWHRRPMAIYLKSREAKAW